MNKKNTKEKAIDSAQEIGKSLYNDLLKPTVTTLGNIISLPFKAIDAALTPLRQWIDNKNYNYEKTRELLAEKLKDKDHSKIVEPEAYVAVPAIQQLAYSFNSEDLREMYANILASSMFEDTKWSVHPSFVEIIKQLSPLDAKALNQISTDYVPIVTILKEDKFKKTRHDLINDYCLDIVDIYPNPYLQSSSIQNLQRLGIINITYEKLARPAYKYNKYYQDDLYKEILNEYKDSEEKIVVLKGSVEFTYFGLDFCTICCNK